MADKQKVYRIANWVSRYEVTQKNHPSKGVIPMECRRVGPLLYVRSKVHAMSMGEGLDDLFALAWRPGSLRHWAIFGIFHKLLEIAADQGRERRGWLLDGDGRPITPSRFAKRFHEIESEGQIAEAFEMLVRNKWLEEHELEMIPGDFRESPEIPGCLYKTKQDKTKQKETQSENPAVERMKQAMFAADAIARGPKGITA